MSPTICLTYRFNPHVQSVTRVGNRLTLDVKEWNPISFTTPTSTYADALMALAGEGASLSRLDEIAAGSGDAAAARKAVRYYADRFAFGRLLQWTLTDDAGDLAVVEALARGYQPKREVPPAGPLRLCRFAYLRQLNGQAVLESARIRARAVLSERGIARLAEALAHPSAASNGFAEALWRLGYFDIEGGAATGPAGYWDFHDLLMHESSRRNRDAVIVGGTYRFKGTVAPLPARKPAMTGTRLDLEKCDPVRIRQGSATFDGVQSRRRSVRDYADTPLPWATLSEFLWRVCRTTAYLPNETEDLISRPYPAGGGINELEFYVAARRCDGLEPSVYHYDSHGHALVQLPASSRAAQKIIDGCASTMELEPARPLPALVIVITTRLPRLAWKYEGMAYRASLLNVGVVYQLMYLVATDMGLAPCATGTGDSRLLDEVAGLDPLEETAIGEFAIGLPATGSAAQEAD
jgi:SagB-type dehydrogenase family enzyme